MAIVATDALGVRGARPRCCAVDLSNEEASNLLGFHVRAGELSKEKLFAYAKSEVKLSPSWRDLWVWRHFLMDAVNLTRGRLHTRA